jgi:isopenicillin-N N-acyltransferase-like protein
MAAGDGISALQLFDLFKDEDGYPGAINRHEVQDCETQTLFNIIMELDKKRAAVTFGRPTNAGERIEFVF